MFKGRKLLIATMHHKEKVVAPILKKELEVEIIVSNNIDTDQLGTFSGEIERKGSAIETLRSKCLLAMKKNQVDLIFASEGSFGAHPFYFFTNANEELVMLKDFKNDIEIVAKVLSSDTNFAIQEVTTFESLQTFCKDVNFPSHAIILKSDYKNFEYCFKGITSSDELYEKFQFLSFKGLKIIAETDMRAMYNPTRMNVIQQATYKLVEKCKSNCPSCNTPGFDVVDVVEGLPCEWCKLPTNSTLKHIYVCQKCNYSEEKIYPLGKKSEDPMYCNNCNP